MAKTQTPKGRQIVGQSGKPPHLAKRAGAGRTRQPTEFDDLVPEWYAKYQDDPDYFFKIPAQGETEEEQLADMDEVFKAVQRAVAHHELGVDRLKEDDPNDEEFTGYGVWVRVRDRQKRTRKPKDENGNVIESDDEGDNDEYAADE